MRPIGLHVRLDDSFDQLFHRVHAHSMDVFQCFLTKRTATKSLLAATDDDKQKLRSLVRKNVRYAFAHGSYWINPSSVRQTWHYTFKKEWRFAQDLGFTHMVVHPGSAKGGQHRGEGIDSLARFVNEVTAQRSGAMQLVLENIANAGMSVGGDLDSFAALLERVDNPDAVSFCIDTAHAHGYGYDIITDQGQDDFLALIDATIGLRRVAAIHLNDTHQLCGSHRDRHERLGSGVIGERALRRFTLHEELYDVPLILELPVMQLSEEQQCMEMVRRWHD